MKLKKQIVRIGGAPGGREAELAAAASDFLSKIYTITIQIRCDIKEFHGAVRLAANALEMYVRIMERFSYNLVVRRGIQALVEGHL